jgi:hypothetical protein
VRFVGPFSSGHVNEINFGAGISRVVFRLAGTRVIVRYPSNTERNAEKAPTAALCPDLPLHDRNHPHRGGSRRGLAAPMP